MKVILSIKPEFAEKILSGEKRFEFRKARFNSECISSVLLYATKPVGRVVGEFEVEGVHVDSPSRIWRKTRRYAGIDKVYFDSYFRAKSTAVAICVGKVNRFDTPRALSDYGENISAPQSFRYLTESIAEPEGRAV